MIALWHLQLIKKINWPSSWQARGLWWIQTSQFFFFIVTLAFLGWDLVNTGVGGYAPKSSHVSESTGQTLTALGLRSLFQCLMTLWWGSIPWDSTWLFPTQSCAVSSFTGVQLFVASPNSLPMQSLAFAILSFYFIICISGSQKNFLVDVPTHVPVPWLLIAASYQIQNDAWGELTLIPRQAEDALAHF